MRKMTVIVLLLYLQWVGKLSAQSFYETIMTQNTANADSSNDLVILERSAMALERLAFNYNQDPYAIYHAALCHIRIADLTAKKDTATASRKLRQGVQVLNKANADSVMIGHSRVLRLYAEVVKSRVRPSAKESMELEKLIAEQRKERKDDPRLCLLQAYLCHLSQSRSKASGKSCEKIFSEAQMLFDTERSANYEPRWGRKWCVELQKGKLKKAATK